MAGKAGVQSSSGTGCVVLAIAAVAVFALGRCSAQEPLSTALAPTVAATPSPVSTPATVSARRLNCRASPERSAVVLSTLRRGTQIAVTDRSGDWSRVGRPEGDCWVSSAQLSNTKA